MSPKSEAFLSDLIALLEKHKATMAWDIVYYPGDSESARFEVGGAYDYVDFKDAASYIENKKKSQ